MFGIALGHLSYNEGALRKEIWKFFMDVLSKIPYIETNKLSKIPSIETNKYEDLINYKDFLATLSSWTVEGSIIRNNNGYYWLRA